ncbi:MAG TPA: thioesterase family protein [Anaeromyxobacter sp.]
MHDALGRYPVSVSIPVAWGEMDAFRHVNNVAYARWVETGRIAYFRRIGFLERMGSEGIGPILARLTIDYRKPVTFPDTVRVDVTTTKIGRSSFTLAYRMWSEAQAAEVVTAEDVIVVMDYRASRAVPVDDALRSAIAALEASASRSSRASHG